LDGRERVFDEFKLVHGWHHKYIPATDKRNEDRKTMGKLNLIFIRMHSLAATFQLVGPGLSFQGSCKTRCGSFLKLAGVSKSLCA
jgi:hypothetical protein